MSKSNKKRVALDSLQSQALDEESKFKVKYQRLLQDYLDLQKEYVSKKKELQIEKQKRVVLLSEVRFLRQRHRYLIDLRSLDHKRGQDLVPAQNSSMHGKLVEDPLRMEEKQKPKGCLIKGKSVGKKKISWQDQGPQRLLFVDSISQEPFSYTCFW